MINLVNIFISPAKTFKSNNIGQTLFHKLAQNLLETNLANNYWKQLMQLYPVSLETNFYKIAQI